MNSNFIVIDSQAEGIHKTVLHPTFKKKNIAKNEIKYRQNRAEPSIADNDLIVTRHTKPVVTVVKHHTQESTDFKQSSTDLSSQVRIKGKISTQKVS